MAISKKEERLDFFTGNELPTIEFTVRKSDGTGVLALTGISSAKVHLRLIGDTANKFSGADEDATVISEPNGRVDYTLPSGGVDDPGVYKGQLELIFAAGNRHTQEFEMIVKEAL